MTYEISSNMEGCQKEIKGLNFQKRGKLKIGLIKI